MTGEVRIAECRAGRAGFLGSDLGGVDGLYLRQVEIHALQRDTQNLLYLTALVLVSRYEDGFHVSPANADILWKGYSQRRAGTLVGQRQQTRVSRHVEMMLPWPYDRLVDLSRCRVEPRTAQWNLGIMWHARPDLRLFENLEDGAQVDQFVQWFPGVSLEQASTVPEHAARSALAPA